MSRFVFVLLPFLLTTACVPAFNPLTQRNSALTQGNVQLTIKTGETTKAEILEAFGAPNITTRDGAGREVWTYQRAGEASQASARSAHIFFLLIGGSGAQSGFESSSRMLTLIIKFDENDVVADFNSRSSNF